MTAVGVAAVVPPAWAAGVIFDLLRRSAREDHPIALLILAVAGMLAWAVPALVSLPFLAAGLVLLWAAADALTPAAAAAHEPPRGQVRTFVLAVVGAAMFASAGVARLVLTDGMQTMFGGRAGIVWLREIPWALATIAVCGAVAGVELGRRVAAFRSGAAERRP